MYNDVIGVPVPTLQYQQLLTDKARYTDDLHVPGMLVGKLLYSAHPCARITKLEKKSIGRPFEEVYDIENVKPTTEWQGIYDEDREELIGLGMPVDRFEQG